MTAARLGSGRVGAPDFAAALSVADAVLYEGYLLYPYRRSSGKNRVRWQFGVLGPRPWIEARGPVAPSVAGAADAWRQRIDCLVEARPGARLHVRLRFLQLQHRSVQRADGSGGFREVDSLEIGSERRLTFDEAVPREADVVADLDALAGQPLRDDVALPSGEDVEEIGSHARVVRSRCAVSAVVRLAVEPAPAPFPLRRVRVTVENAVRDLPVEASRPEALARSLVATHCLLGLEGGAFLSALDPPAWAAAAARKCVHEHAFPVLAGAGGARDVVLSSPIILYDHPEVAPESPGDLFDATEIDEILSLRTLTLTEEEKREARATDPRAAEIVDRVDAIPAEVFARLHGAVRSLRPVSTDRTDGTGGTDGADSTGGTDGRDDAGSAGETDAGSAAPPLPVPSAPWWDPGADSSVSPGTDAVLVDGTPVARGSRVRLHPRAHGTDVHDMFLEGRIARVEAVLLDVDDARHVAVVLEDDPGADLHRWYGRYHYFAPEEIEPLGDSR